MAYILGSTVPLAVTIVDDAGQPASPSTISLEIELPDGTTTTVLPTNDAPGHYAYDYVADTLPGRYGVYWVTTAPYTAIASVFDVRRSMPRYIISLLDAKRALNMPATGTRDDDELTGHIEAATDAIELYLRETVVRRTVVERHRLADPVTSLVLATYPIVSVTSIVAADASQAWTATTLDVDTGVVSTASPAFHGDLIVTCVAGRSEIPANYSRAAEIVVRNLWESQRSIGAGPKTPEEAMDVDRYGVVIPPRARELLGSTAPMVG
jgi:hypothetical protein